MLICIILMFLVLTLGIILHHSTKEHFVDYISGVQSRSSHWAELTCSFSVFGNFIQALHEFAAWSKSLEPVFCLEGKQFRDCDDMYTDVIPTLVVIGLQS